MMLSPWRRELYKKISSLELKGRVIDLGGSRKSDYHRLFQGEHEIEVANLDEKAGYDHRIDLEKPLPLPSETYDAVISLNVFEHIFNYELLLSESVRILKKNGIMVMGVPFLINVHGSPNDYWRYTGQTLQLLFEKAGIKDVEIFPLGRGPFTAGVQIIVSALRYSVFKHPLILAASTLDFLLSLLLSRDILIRRYPLGYVVTARK